jgi:3-deoxy-D-manno-octulosonic-acid transferase
MHLPLYFGLYQLFGWISLVAAFPLFLLYSICTGRYRKGLEQRFGFFDVPEKGADKSLRIWLHGASVGEVLLAKVLIGELTEIYPEAVFTISTVTEQGMEVARKQLPAEVQCIYAPLDLVGIVDRAINKINPSVKIPKLMADILSCFSMISVIRSADAKRFIGLGAEPEKIRILGNAKYDQQAGNVSDDDEKRFRSWLDLKQDQPLFVAGSTHSGEEGALLSVFKDLKQATGMQELIWLVAPRHMQRLPEVEALFNENNIAFEMLSQVKSGERKSDIILVDQIGDLAGLYSVATYVFCGGSLVDRGGHNIMEPAILGKPVFYGPYMKDFQDAAELLESVGAGFPVSRSQELTESILYFMDHPEEYTIAGTQAREIAFAQQGSARKQAQLVKEVLFI